MPDTREPQSVIDRAEQAAVAGDYASAERLLREAADLQEASLGPLHPDLANTLNNLGVVCEITEKPADAERCFRRAYEIATAVLEPDHPFVATSRQNLEDFCAARGIEVRGTGPATTTAPMSPSEIAPAATVVRQTEPPNERRIEPQIEPTKVPPQRSMDQAPRPEAAGRSSRPIPIGALVAAGLLVTLLAATMWFRAKDGRATGREHPAPTAAARPSEQQRPVEQRPVEPSRRAKGRRRAQSPSSQSLTEPAKANDVPKAESPRQSSSTHKCAGSLEKAGRRRRLAMRSPGQSGRCGAAPLLHSPQVSHRHDGPASLVSRRSPAAERSSSTSRQPRERISHLQSQHGVGVRRVEGRAQNARRRPAPRGTLHRSVRHRSTASGWAWRALFPD